MSNKEVRIPTVWIVYNDGMRDFKLGERFGKLKTLISGNYKERFQRDPGYMLDDMREILSSYHPGDFLIMVGEPALCGLAITVIREVLSGGEVNILRWNNFNRDYQALAIPLFSLGEQETRKSLAHRLRPEVEQTLMIKMKSEVVEKLRKDLHNEVVKDLRKGLYHKVFMELHAELSKDSNAVEGTLSVDKVIEDGRESQTDFDI